MARRIKSASLVLLFNALILLTSVPRAIAAAGDLDPTFSGNGTVRTGFSATDVGAIGQAVAIQGDGKIVVAGTVETADFVPLFGLVRYATDGTLDSTFGVDGKVETTFPDPNSVNETRASDVAIQTDGKIVAVGEGPFGFAIARYNPDGSLDTSFSTDGLQTTAVNGLFSVATAVSLQADGKIVVAGYVVESDTFQRRFALVRYNADGSLDSGFGLGGIAVPPWSKNQSSAQDVAIQPDGEILVAGNAVFANSDFVLVRYNSDGSLDPSFSGNGKARIDFGGSDQAHKAAIQDDGKIVVVGNTRQPGEPFDFAISRVTPDGSRDPTFSGDGEVKIDFSGYADSANGVAIQTDGRIAIGGYARRAKGAGASESDFGLARLRPGGALDPRFGGGDGKVMTRIGAAAVGRDLALEDGKIAVVGESYSAPYPTGGFYFAVARYLGS